jgi:hypothetical protein
VNGHSTTHGRALSLRRRAREYSSRLHHTTALWSESGVLVASPADPALPHFEVEPVLSIMTPPVWVVAALVDPGVAVVSGTLFS